MTPNTPFIIKGILADGKPHTAQQITDLTGIPISTVKRFLKQVLPNIGHGRLGESTMGAPIHYWQSPSEYDNIVSRPTKMEKLKEMLLNGEPVDYLTFGNKSEGDAIVYSYVERLREQGWQILEKKNNGKTSFYLKS